MAIQNGVCPNCGGTLDVDDVDLNGFCKCPYCDTSHKIVEMIAIDGLPTAKSLIENAMMCLNDGEVDKASKYFNDVVQIKPNCHEAWWGMYLCNSSFDRYYQYKDKYGRSGPLTKAGIMENTINKYAMKAIKFAPQAQADEYRQKIQGELDFIEKARRGDFDDTSQGKGKSGCYIATAVYGDHSCDEVFALRRYRDDFLAQYMIGRLIIRVYYKISPYLAAHIRKESFISRCIRSFLDKKVKTITETVTNASKSR